MAGTYFDGAGRERCAATGKEVSVCRCYDHKPKKSTRKKSNESLANDVLVESTRKRSDRVYRSKEFEVPIGHRIPQSGDKVNVVNAETKEEMEIEITEVHSVAWLDDRKAGVNVDMSYRILESNLYIKPSVKRVH